MPKNEAKCISMKRKDVAVDGGDCNKQRCVGFGFSIYINLKLWNLKFESSGLACAFYPDACMMAAIPALS